jgi:ribosomal protein S18 acetylase RimI-like enzyme
MNKTQAQQIADLLNTQNQLTVKYTADKVLASQADILFHAGDGGKVTCAVEVSRVQWYQAEIKHLTVHPDCKRQGLGRQLLAEAEDKAVKLDALIAQRTVRDNNTPSIKLFLSSGYRHTVTVRNPESGNKIMVLQKPI